MSAEKRPEPCKHDLLPSERISQNAVAAVVKDIFDINRDDDKKEELYKNRERKPIRLFINSYGGNVYDGLALVDIIKRSKTPVHTVCISSCMSMALWVWLSGARRFIGEAATLMFHDISRFAVDKTEGIMQELKEIIRIQEMPVAEITGSSLLKEETLRDYISRKSEWYIPADEAIMLKLADKYYKQAGRLRIVFFESLFQCRAYFFAQRCGCRHLDISDILHCPMHHGAGAGFQ